MPIKHAAEKALRQAQKSVVINRKTREAIRRIIKDGRKMVAAGKTDEARTLSPKIAQLVDKAAKRGIVKKNTAARIKARFAASLKALAKK